MSVVVNTPNNLVWATATTALWACVVVLGWRVYYLFKPAVRVDSGMQIGQALFIVKFVALIAVFRALTRNLEKSHLGAVGVFTVVLIMVERLSIVNRSWFAVLSGGSGGGVLFLLFPSLVVALCCLGLLVMPSRVQFRPAVFRELL